MFDSIQDGKDWAINQGWSLTKHKEVWIAFNSESDQFFSLEAICDQLFWTLLP